MLYEYDQVKIEERCLYQWLCRCIYSIQCEGLARDRTLHAVLGSSRLSAFRCVLCAVVVSRSAESLDELFLDKLCRCPVQPCEYNQCQQAVKSRILELWSRVRRTLFKLSVHRFLAPECVLTLRIAVVVPSGDENASLAAAAVARKAGRVKRPSIVLRADRLWLNIEPR